jgi:hypothetical protein
MGDNISTISSVSNRITLSTVLSEIETWRAERPYKTMKIPDRIWSQVFIVLKTDDEATVLRRLGLKPSQLKTKRDEMKINGKDKYASAEVDFITPIPKLSSSVAQDNTSDFGLTYKPAEAFATNTSVVELYRPDGMLMKIHICTERFEELFLAFSKTNGQC